MQVLSYTPKRECNVKIVQCTYLLNSYYIIVVIFDYGWTDIQSGYPNPAGFLLTGQIGIRLDFMLCIGLDSVTFFFASVGKVTDNYQISWTSGQ